MSFYPAEDERNKGDLSFKVASTRQSIEHLAFMLNCYSRLFYSRFGDGEFRLMIHKSDSHHKRSRAIRKELVEAFKIKDAQFIKSATLGIPLEPDIRGKMFKEISTRGKARVKSLQRIAKLFTNERIFYNPIVFHYLSIHNPELLKDFVEMYIKPKAKMFIGGNKKEAMEQFYGPIDYFVKTPSIQAYYSIKQWWPEVLKNIDKCRVVLPSAGAASTVICKRLWYLNTDVHCINMGSINCALDGMDNRGWIRQIGLKKIRNNLLS